MPARGEQAIEKDLALTKAAFVRGQLVTFRVQSTGSTEQPKLTYTLFSEQPLTPEVSDAAADRIRFYLSLDDDLQPFYELGRDDTYFQPVIDKLYGYHQVKFSTPFENASWAVLTQRNQMANAQRMKTALVERFGGSITRVFSINSDADLCRSS